MTYVGVGCYADNERIPTKKLLKQMMTESPSLVRFDQTSWFRDNGLPRLFGISEVPTGITLTVVGPDPYTKRSWYASIQVIGGKPVVS